MPGLFSKASMNLHNTLSVSALLFNLLSVLGSKKKKKTEYEAQRVVIMQSKLRQIE